MRVLRPFYVDSPSTWDEQDDGLDFSADPDQLHDKLPQPFRLVNKILESLLDDAWSRIKVRDEARESESKRRHLPKLEGGIKVSLPYKLHSVCTTPDNKLVIGGGDGGLLAFSNDDVTRPIYKFNIEREYLKVHVTSGTEDGTYILATLDSTGSVCLYGVTRAGFIEISQLLIEEEETVLDIELNQSNLALSLVDKDNNTSVLFQTLPLASWSEPLEQISSLRLQGTAEEEQVFPKPEVRGRIRSPGPVVPCSKSQLSEALVPILATINNPVPLGQGLHHILPKAYFDNRREMLGKLPKYHGVDWDTVDDSVHVAHVVYTGDGKVVVWWSQHHIATLHYVTADIEAVDDNFVFCSNVTCVTSSSSGNMLGVGLEKGLAAVIQLQDGITLQSSLVSRSPVDNVEFIENRLLASCQDGSVAVLSCAVEGSCATIQHIASDTVPYSVTQLYHIALYSNIAVVSLSPGRVAIVDVDSFRAVAAVPAVGTVSNCVSLAKKCICMISLDTECLAAKFRAIHPYTEHYHSTIAAPGDHGNEVPVMYVYDVTDNEHVIEKGYVNTANAPQNTISLLSQAYFTGREVDKSSRHERLRERWFQYTEELECY